MADQYSLAFGRKVRGALEKNGIAVRQQSSAEEPKNVEVDGLEKIADVEGDLEKLIAQEPMTAIFVAQDFGRIAGMWAEDSSRPQAETMLKAWAEHGEPLRKAMSMAWLSRAKSTLAHAVEGKGAKQLSEAGHTAHSGPSERFREPPPSKNHEHAQGHTQREEGHAERLSAPNPPTLDLGTKVAQHSRRQMRNTLRTGAAVAAGTVAAGTAIAAGAHYSGKALSDKQREERRNAAKARWSRRGQAAQ